jgi:hypothetical protein
MKKIQFIFTLSLLALIFSSCDKGLKENKDLLIKGVPAPIYIDVNLLGDCPSGPIDLIAGQHTVVGQIYVEKDVDTDCLNVTYKIDDAAEGDWFLTEVHLELVTNPNAFPMTNSGNPKIGNFKFKYSFSPFENKKEFAIPECIPLPKDASGKLISPVYIAAHGVVGNKENVIGYTDTPDFEEFCASLPETVDLKVIDGGLGYFTTTITDGGWLDGKYPGWCLVRIIDMPRNTLLDNYNVFCSLDPNLKEYGLFDYPENMPQINYILNQNYPGKPAGTFGTITKGDVQFAIWELIDEHGAPGLNDRVNWILNDVALNTPNFVLGCGSVIGVIIAPPRNPDGTYPTQVTIIPVPINCELYGDETIWARGFDFPGNNWAMFFKYCLE